jgi:hypothetical protein
MPEPQDHDTLTQERFARVRMIFEAALERPTAERRGYVDGACAADDDLRKEIRRMLAAEAKTDVLLDHASKGKPPSSAPDEGRFPAGTVLAGRYRILGMLGKGGMGEVYRAFDLILNQAVALKFLSAAHFGEAALERFRNEVRVARQVSHPNVCRVYDLGMVEGLHFLSMEYIDGEDLASLLRRIGRLPPDKATEFTRTICAGLSAAHERGVLHRDLKPANIMIDGRGQVRITDFGLAGLAAEIPLRDLRSGTPAYMSPEQKEGKEVTTRSDIYSLGLVLHEMFTGKVRKDTQSTPGDLVKDLDPAVERLILRCLEEDPKRRPQTALNVAMALPGADPIAVALAAGETPSPEMVAASTEKEGIGARTAVLCFVIILAMIAAGAWIDPRSDLLEHAPIETPPDAMAYRARQILQQLGYTEPPFKSAYGFDCCDRSNFEYASNQSESRRDVILASHRPPVLRFWYRQHRAQIWATPYLDGRPEHEFGGIDYELPANTEPGMIRLALDAKERLIALEVRPWKSAAPDQLHDSSGGAEWNALLAAAGLDRNVLVPTSPERIPPMSFDNRAAWTGIWDGRPGDKLRIEAASWQGQPVYFEVNGDWHQPKSSAFNGSSSLGTSFVLVLILAVIGATFLARQNLKAGRGDHRGAAISATLSFASGMMAWALFAAHVPNFWELSLLGAAVGSRGIIAAIIWLAYIAIEPYMRRQWPDALISWTRLQAGRFRDPLVASHILIGITVIYCSQRFGGLWILGSHAITLPISIFDLDSSARLAAKLLWQFGDEVLYAVIFVLAVVVVRLLVRRVWIADLLVTVVVGLQGLFFYGSPFGVVASIVFSGATLWLLRRFGFLAVLAAFFALVPAGEHFSLNSWYAGHTLVAMGITVAVALWALWVIVSAPRGTAWLVT